METVHALQNRYNETKILSDTKQKFLLDSSVQARQKVCQWFEKKIADLNDAQYKILNDIESERDQIQVHLYDLNEKVEAIGDQIETLIETGTIINDLTAKLDDLNKKLDNIDFPAEHSLLARYKVSLTNDVHNNVSTEVICKDSQTDLTMKDMTQNGIQTENSLLTNSEEDENGSMDANPSSFRINDTVPMYQNVGRIASNGEGLLYCSPILNLLCYRQLNQTFETHCDWTHSPIEDMIWWSNLNSYLCATLNGVYTVKYDDGDFRVRLIIPGKWKYVRVACNHEFIWTWIYSKLNAFYGLCQYSKELELVRTIDFKRPSIGNFIDGSLSFCVQDNVFASVCHYRVNKRNVFRVTLCNTSLTKEIFTAVLGQCGNTLEIRSDINGYFFIATGTKKLWIIKQNGEKWFLELANNLHALTVLDDRDILIATDTNNLQRITRETNG
ncbi:unnamed protein product [Didymodactylos carnosus]|uniref:Uncharacterized protein n=1 Tax=Didymodactylos carnosus TaxID=1234261 RepID=A0A814D203_9BILA|nr:unnamed protein product [Didymodactylos carnosus]CAF0968408.1 unnamed protein product [Didymodactylos carnosus]CAF3723775.1 unnamed protein product [Didymodactylos carnosus]CAF3740058.1 unnamed protein product [Didymodactylos carnosus]